MKLIEAYGVNYEKRYIPLYRITSIQKLQYEDAIVKTLINIDGLSPMLSSLTVDDFNKIFAEEKIEIIKP